MNKTLVVFAAAGGLVVPIVLTLLGWVLRRSTPDAATALALLHEVQLSLWPMSKLILDDPAGKHWLYLPLAAVLSNALVYGALGLLAAWGRTRRIGVGIVWSTALLLLVAGWQGFGTSDIAFAIAGAVVFAGLALHHRVAR
jgi:hypothetical protein